MVDTQGRDRYNRVIVTNSMLLQDGAIFRKLVCAKVLRGLRKTQPTSSVIWRVERFENFSTVTGYAGPHAVEYAQREREHRKDGLHQHDDPMAAR